MYCNVFKHCVMLSSLVNTTFLSRSVYYKLVQRLFYKLCLKAAMSDNIVILPILFILKHLQVLRVKASIRIFLLYDVFPLYISA